MRKIEPEVQEYMNSGPTVGTAKKSKEPKKFYPTLRLEHKFFPEAKKWEVGKMYKVTLELKQTGLSISKFQNDSEFEIQGFESKDMKSVVDKEK